MGNFWVVPLLQEMSDKNLSAMWHIFLVFSWQPAFLTGRGYSLICNTIGYCDFRPIIAKLITPKILIRIVLNYFSFYFFNYSSTGKPFQINFTDLNEHKVLHEVFDICVTMHR